MHRHNPSRDDGHADDIAQAKLCTAYSEAGDHQKLLETATRWSESARAHGNAEARASALYYVGQAQEALGNPDAALDAYLAAAEVDPANPAAYHAGALLEKRGEDARAGRILEEYLPHASGWRRAWTARLLERLAQSAERPAS